MRSRPIARAAGVLALGVAVVAGPAGPAGAQASRVPPLRLDVRNGAGHRAHIMATPAAYRAARKQARLDGVPSDSTTPLLQGSGPIMQDPTYYLIFWQPDANTKFDANYQTKIEQYFKDVGGTPFLNVETQYCDKNGNCPKGTATFGGSWTDTNAYTDNSGNDGTSTKPLSDADIQDAVSDAIAANSGWQAPGLNTMYFVFTGYFINGSNKQEPIHSCFSSSECFAGLSTNDVAAGGYCAYHSTFQDNGQDVIYASQPYAPIGACYPSSYNGGPYPNDNSNVDIEISVVSHEMLEANTDPLLNAWKDKDGNSGEIGDKCAYLYPWGDPNAGPFEPDGTNVVLNGDPYFLQTEWSNAAVVWNQTQPPGQNPGALGCVKRFGKDSDASIVPSSIGMGTVPGGTSATRTITLTNTGQGDMNLLNSRLSAGSSGRFALSGPVHATIKPGQSRTFQVTFSSPALNPGSYSANVVLDVDDPQPRYTYSIPVEATAGDPKVTLSRSSIAFGGVATDDRTSPNTLNQTIDVSNTGTADLTLAQVDTSSSADFAVSSPVTLPATIAPGGDITLTVSFDPTTPGARAGTLEVWTNSPGTNPRTVPLSGTGLTPGIGFSPGTIVFAPTVLPSQVPGYGGSTTNLGVTNVGQAELVVDSQTATGSGFSVPSAANPPARYSPNTGYSLPVTFAPTAVGKSVGSVTVADTASEAPVSGSVSLCGEGVHRGIRVLVVNGSGTPYPSVAKLKLTSHNTSPGINLNVSNLALTAVTTSCVAGQKEQYENQALPAAPGGTGTHASYYTLSVSVGGKSATRDFTLQANEFRELVVTVK
jgi:hypothetical protein